MIDKLKKGMLENARNDENESIEEEDDFDFDYDDDMWYKKEWQQWFIEWI